MVDTDFIGQGDEALNSFESNTYSLIGSFTNVKPTAGDPKVVSEQSTTITWDKVGAAIGQVVLDYTLNGSDWNILDDGDTEGTVANARMLDHVLLPNTQPYRWQYPLGREPGVGVSKFVRLRVKANATLNVSGYIIWEE